MKKVTRLTESDLTRIVKRVVKENKNQPRPFRDIIEDFITSFEFSQKGNDEMLEVIEFLISENGGEKLANLMFDRLKRGYGEPGEGLVTYVSDQDKLSRVKDMLKQYE